MNLETRMYSECYDEWAYGLMQSKIHNLKG
jgi:hypothetical protein